jgi:hypothetical protein
MILSNLNYINFVKRDMSVMFAYWVFHWFYLHQRVIAHHAREKSSLQHCCKLMSL